MKKFVLILVLGFTFQSAICQEFEMIRHQVKMGETVRMLSKKYKVEPSEIYRLNKFAIDGIRDGMVLQILVEKKDVDVADAQSTLKEYETGDEMPAIESNSPQTGTVVEERPASDDVPAQVQEISHTVAKGETLYSLSKKYNVAVEDIKSWNEQVLKKGLQSGQVLLIKTNN